jgi:hypothetical protein
LAESLALTEPLSPCRVRVRLRRIVELHHLQGSGSGSGYSRGSFYLEELDELGYLL